jgi:hypothetical protein
MARKAWDALSSSYRRRLERSGIDRAAYDRGESLKAARGHARTPERPRQAARAPERYPDYVRRHGTRTPIPGGEAFDVGPDVPDSELRDWLADQASKGRSISARMTVDDLVTYGGAKTGPGDVVLYQDRGYQARYLLNEMRPEQDIRSGLLDQAMRRPGVEQLGQVQRVQFTAYNPIPGRGRQRRRG